MQEVARDRKLATCQRHSGQHLLIRRYRARGTPASAFSNQRSCHASSTNRASHLAAIVHTRIPRLFNRYTSCGRVMPSTRAAAERLPCTRATALFSNSVSMSSNDVASLSSPTPRSRLVTFFDTRLTSLSFRLLLSDSMFSELASEPSPPRPNILDSTCSPLVNR